MQLSEDTKWLLCAKHELTKSSHSQSLIQQLKRQVATTLKCDAEAFYLDEGTHVQQFMHKHKEREAYLWVSWVMGIYSGKHPNEHATIVDVEGK
jgi:K+-sensing histidine kinase KdpD